MLDWTADPAALLVIAVAAALYGRGVQRVGRRGRRWPLGRSAAFVTGLVAVAVATSSGLGVHDDERFAAHAGQHVLLGMVAPFLFALSAPITLALQASSRGVGAVIRELLDSRPGRLLAHPLTGWSLFGSALIAGLYSPLLESSLRSDVVHVAVHGSYVAAGCLFLWPLVGHDPSPWRIPHAVRLLLMLAAVPFHSFVGAALTTGDTLLAPEWYGLDDQRMAGGIIWSSGSMLGLVGGGVVLWQWMRHDERAAAREDRQATVR